MFLRKTLFENSGHLRGAAARRLHLRERAARGVLRRRRAGRQRHWERVKLDPEPARRAADAGVAAGDDGEAGSHRSGPARQVRAQSDPVPVGEPAVARDRGDVQAAGPEQDGARPVHRAPRPTRCARPATMSWTRSGCRSSTTTPSGGGATTIAAWTIDATGEIDGKHLRRRARRWRASWPTCPTRAPATSSEWLRFSEGKLNVDADEAYVDWLMSRFSRNTSIVDLVTTMVGSDTFRYLRAGGGCAVKKPMTMKGSMSDATKPAPAPDPAHAVAPRAAQGRAGRRRRAAVAGADAAARPPRAVAVGAPKRFGVFFSPCGTIPENWRSTRATAGRRPTSRCRRSCSRCSRSRTTLVVLRGMNFESSQLVGPIANVHDQGMTHMLTATAPGEGAGRRGAREPLPRRVGGRPVDRPAHRRGDRRADAAAVAGAGRREHGHVPRDAGHAHELRARRRERPVQARDPDPARRRPRADLRAPDRQHAGGDDRADPGGAAEPEVGARLRGATTTAI